MRRCSDIPGAPVCPFGGVRVEAKGNPKASFVIVGESPGKEEVIKGIPMIGASGKSVHAELPEGMWNEKEPEKSSVYILNAMRCFPRKDLKANSGYMHQAATTCGKNWLYQKLLKHRRKVILCLGNAAAWSITGNYGIKITQDRGKVWDTPYADHTVTAVHPAALMRGTGSFRQYQADFKYALSFLKSGERPKVKEARFEIIRHHTEVIQPTHEMRDGGMTHLMDYLNHHQVGFDGIMASDVETTGLNNRLDEILLWGICPTPERAYIFTPEMIPWMRPLWENPQIRWCWHNGKFDIGFARRYGARVSADEDTMLMSYAMDERGGVHGLETVAKDLLHAPDYKDMLKPYLPKKDSSYSLVPTPVLAKYLGIDLGLTKQIQQEFHKRLARDEVANKLYRQTLLPASDLLSNIESHGLYVNWEQHTENLTTFAEEVKEKAAILHDICGKPVNPNSPADMAWMLFDKFGLRKIKKRSTAKEVLNVHKEHFAVQALLEYRRVQKAYSTYVVPLPRYVEPDGRVHSTYALHTTPTGRLASKDPNLQNQPRLAVLRGQFMAGPGNRYTEVDLSQAELRSLAALSRDARLVEIYLDNTRSLHKEVAREKYGPNYTKDEYVRAKAVNFGIVYGRTAFTLAQEFKIPVTEAQAMIDAWYDMFSGAGEFIEACRRTPITKQVITTCFGRRKRHGIVAGSNLWALQNEAANFPHQSIASDITLHAAIRCREPLARIGVKIVNLVHDSILTEHADNDELSMEVGRILGKELEQVPIDWGITTVPFKSDASTGRIWGALKEFEVAV